MPLTATAVIGGIQSIYQLGTGISQISKAKRMEENNPRPTFDIQKEYFDNQSLAQSMAQGGLTDKALDYYTTESRRGFTAGTDTSLQVGGSVNSINSLFDNYQRGLQEVAMKDSQLQTENMKYLIDRNKDLAGQKTQKWVLNEYEPYKDTAQAVAAMRAGGAKNINTGLSTAAGVGASLYTANLNEQMLATGQPQANPNFVNDGSGSSDNVRSMMRATPFGDVNAPSPFTVSSTAPAGATSMQPMLASSNYSRSINKSVSDMSIDDMYNSLYGNN